MSKLADKIKRVTRMSPQPLGFGAMTAAAEPTLVLAGMAKDAAAAADLARRGADIVIIGSAGSPADAAAAKAAGEVVSGGWIAGRSDGESKAYREGGFDFVIFGADAAATSLLDENVGYVMALPDDLSDNDLRTLEAFQLDAVVVGAIEGALTVRRQIALRRIFATTRKPLMATVSGSITTPELQALRDTNVVIIAVEGPDNVERLRTAIASLPPRARRKDGDDRPTPLVPRATVSEEHDHGEEE